MLKHFMVATRVTSHVNDKQAQVSSGRCRHDSCTYCHKRKPSRMQKGKSGPRLESGCSFSGAAHVVVPAAALLSDAVSRDRQLLQTAANLPGKPHLNLRAVMGGRQTTAELHAFVRQLLVDALRCAVRNDNGMPSPGDVRPSDPDHNPDLASDPALCLHPRRVVSVPIRTP